MERPKLENLTGGGTEGTHGELHNDDVSITFGGACPVQGYGLIRGEYPCYYRARGTGWQFEVYEPGTDLDEGLDGEREVFSIAEAPYTWPDGGWLRAEESQANIHQGVAAFLARRAQGTRLRGYQARVGNVSSPGAVARLPEGAEPAPQDPKVEQRMAELRWRLVGIDLGRLLVAVDELRADLDLPPSKTSFTEPTVDPAMREAMIRGVCYGLRESKARDARRILPELNFLALLTGFAWCRPED